MICPATEKHVNKYVRQETFLIKETEEDYESITLPYINSQSFSLQVGPGGLECSILNNLCHFSILFSHGNIFLSLNSLSFYFVSGIQVQSAIFSLGQIPNDFQFTLLALYVRYNNIPELSKCDIQHFCVRLCFVLCPNKILAPH